MAGQMQHGQDAFVVQILDSQNFTWQGVVTWAGGKRTQPFRSALELMKLIDGAVGTSRPTAPPAAGET